MPAATMWATVVFFRPNLNIKMQNKRMKISLKSVPPFHVKCHVAKALGPN